MCGIVGYIAAGSASTKPAEVVLEGLRRLEYRGYDSAGIAVAAPGAKQLSWAKKAGKLGNLRNQLEETPVSAGTAAIGHTRWATHGSPTDENAHPHLVADDTIAVIHN